MSAIDLPLAVPRPARRRRSHAESRAVRLGLLFAAPAVLLLVATYILPLLALLGFSATDYEMGALSFRFVGLDNFLHAFGDPVFLRALANTALYAAIVIPLGVVLALGIALLVHGCTRRRALWEVAYFLPVTATLVAMATVWQFVLHPALGPVNAVIRALGLEPVAFLTNPKP